MTVMYEVPYDAFMGPEYGETEIRSFRSLKRARAFAEENQYLGRPARVWCVSRHLVEKAP